MLTKVTMTVVCSAAQNEALTPSTDQQFTRDSQLDNAMTVIGGTESRAKHCDSQC